MFEQQQNTGKSASLAEKYANAVGQLSDAKDRAAHAEHDLQVERITRQDLIDEEVARRVAEAEERIRKELEAQLADKTKELEGRNKAYLFCRDLDACKRAAMMYSLFGACKVLDKNPERWLCYVLKHIDSTPEDKYYTLLPEFWEDVEQQKRI